MILADLIYEETKALPNTQAQEVLNFINYLKYKIINQNKLTSFDALNEFEQNKRISIIKLLQLSDTISGRTLHLTDVQLEELLHD